MWQGETTMTLEQIEKKLMSEGKTGYAVISLNPYMADRHVRIGYFKNVAEYHHMSYEEDEVEFVRYAGWDL